MSILLVKVIMYNVATSTNWKIYFTPYQYGVEGGGGVVGDVKLPCTYPNLSTIIYVCPVNFTYAGRVGMGDCVT